MQEAPLAERLADLLRNRWLILNTNVNIHRLPYVLEHSLPTRVVDWKNPLRKLPTNVKDLVVCSKYKTMNFVKTEKANASQHASSERWPSH